MTDLQNNIYVDVDNLLNTFIKPKHLHSLRVLLLACRVQRYKEPLYIDILETSSLYGTITESGVLCDNITEFGVAEDHLSP